MEYVVLVNENNEEVGVSEKDAVHSIDTPLHRGFSVFIFNSRRQILLQQRSRSKKTFPLFWSNSCCGHPLPKESIADAINRRMIYELGISTANIIEILPDFRYKTGDNNIFENEICPVWVGKYDGGVKINPHEVENFFWQDWDIFLKRVQKNDPSLSFWCKEEAKLLSENVNFVSFLK